MSRLEQLQEFLEQNPSDPFLKYCLALEYQGNNDDGNARSIFEELLSVNPQYLATYYQLGKLYERVGNNELAIKTFEAGKIVARDQKDNHTLSELQSALDDLIE